MGETLLFREGRAKGVGRIRALTGAHGSGGSAGDPVGALPVRPAATGAGHGETPVSVVASADGSVLSPAVTASGVGPVTLSASVAVSTT